MIFVIQTDDEVAGLDIHNALSRAGISCTILSKQHDDVAQQIEVSEVTEGCSCEPDWFDPACSIHGA